MNSEEITLSFLEINSFITFSASSIVIGLCVSDALATILLNTPSNSLILESILLAIFDKRNDLITSSNSISDINDFLLKIP